MDSLIYTDLYLKKESTPSFNTVQNNKFIMK